MILKIPSSLDPTQYLLPTPKGLVVLGEGLRGSRPPHVGQESVVEDLRLKPLWLGCLSLNPGGFILQKP